MSDTASSATPVDRLVIRLRGAMCDEHNDGVLLEDAADTIENLERALRHCVYHFVDADNLTTQMYDRAYRDTLNGKRFSGANVRVDG